MVHVQIDFDKRIRDWDGFGFNYVETAQTPDYEVTSTSWSRMDAAFIYEMRGNIYAAKNNAIIPWAGIQRSSKWVGGDPNPGTAFRIHEDGTYGIEQGYYYYKQICPAGRPGMAVARAVSTATEIGVIAFSSNGTRHPDAFIVINLDSQPAALSIQVSGSKTTALSAYRTSTEEQYRALGTHPLEGGALSYTAPPNSVTTFYGMKG